jgi:hypothetical protein
MHTAGKRSEAGRGRRAGGAEQQAAATVVLPDYGVRTGRENKSNKKRKRSHTKAKRGKNLNDLNQTQCKGK